MFIPRQPMSEMGKIFDLADALLVHLIEDDLFKITIPSKTQSYLSAGRPIIMAMEGDAADLVVEADAGVICDSDDPDALAETVTGLSRMEREKIKGFGTNGKEYYQKKLSIDCGVDSFESVFNDLGACAGGNIVF